MSSLNPFQTPWHTSCYSSVTTSPFFFLSFFIHSLPFTIHLLPFFIYFLRPLNFFHSFKTFFSFIFFSSFASLSSIPLLFLFFVYFSTTKSHPLPPINLTISHQQLHHHLPPTTPPSTHHPPSSSTRQCDRYTDGRVEGLDEWFGSGH